MIGSSLVLITIAAVFLRNQVKPDRAAGPGGGKFRQGPRGAGTLSSPVWRPAKCSRAASAFIQMRERIQRHVQQRTEMLAGVSHDLKNVADAHAPAATCDDAEGQPTPRPMLGDSRPEMERMVSEYLEFARGEGGEAAEQTDLALLAEEAVTDGARARDPDGGAQSH